MRKRKYPDWLRYVIIGAGVVIAIKLYKTFRAGKTAILGIGADLSNSVQAAGVQAALNQSGISSGDVRAGFVLNVCEDVYAAFYKNDFLGFSEDEEKAVNAFNSLSSIAEAKAAKGIYKANYNKDLYTDFKKYVYTNGDQWNAIKTYLLNAIK